MLDTCEHIETSALLEEIGISKSELQKIISCQSELNKLSQGLIA